MSQKISSLNHNPYIGLFQQDGKTIRRLISKNVAPRINHSSPHVGFFMYPWIPFIDMNPLDKCTQTKPDTRSIGVNTDVDDAIRLGDQLLAKEKLANEWQKLN